VVEGQAELLTGPHALADRPVTLGEQILGALATFGHEDRSVDFAKQLQQEGASSEVAGEARKLERLFSHSGIPDAHAHESEIRRTLARIEMIAQRLHHRPARGGI
jgi:hypothetical protein